MPRSEAALFQSPLPRRRVTIAVVAGAAGDAPMRKISERLTAWSREAFDPSPLRIPLERSDDDPAPLMEALLAGRADFAACSAERLPLELPSGIRLEGAMRVADPHYRLLVEPGRTGFDGLDDGSVVAVSDPAARAQLLYLRPTLKVDLVAREELLVTGMSHRLWDAAIISALALDVPNLELQLLASHRLVAPSGRGVIALLAADATDPAEPWRRLLNEPDTEDCLLCERAFLARTASWATGLPIARASRAGGRLELNGLLAHPDGNWLVSARASGPPSFGRILGLEVAESCRELATSRQTPLLPIRLGRRFQ